MSHELSCAPPVLESQEVFVDGKPASAVRPTFESQPLPVCPDRRSMKRDLDRRRVAWGLAGVFLTALVMGPGPGSMLVDGSPAAPNFLLGIPALYLWLLFWLFIMAGCVVVAARCLWQGEE